MNFRRGFLLLWIILWVCEPFLVLAAQTPSAKPSLCSTCGMKDKCGVVCCAHLSQADPECGTHDPGLYAAGCSSPDKTTHFLSEDRAKWFLPTAPWIAPAPSGRYFHFFRASFTVPFLEILSPPPKTGFFA